FEPPFHISNARATSCEEALIFADRTMQPTSSPSKGSHSPASELAWYPCSRATCPSTCMSPQEIERHTFSVGESPNRATYRSRNAGSNRTAQGTQEDSCSTIAHTNAASRPCRTAAARAKATRLSGGGTSRPFYFWKPPKSIQRTTGG